MRIVRLAALAIWATATAAIAQDQLIDLVPRQEFSDANGVDMSGPFYRHHESLLSIGGGARSLDLVLNLTSPGPPHETGCFGDGFVPSTVYGGLNANAYFGNTAPATALFTAVLPHQSGKFGIYAQPGSNPYPLIVTPADDAYVTGAYDANYSHFNYVGADGTEATFSNLHAARAELVGAMAGMAVNQIKFPDGETWTYRYNDVTANFTSCYGLVSRVRSIVSSRGYALQFDYVDDPVGTVTSRNILQNFVTVVRVTAYNKASVSCNEALLAMCPAVATLPSAAGLTYGNQSVTITKPNGETVELGFTLGGTGPNVTSVTRPGGVTRTMHYEEYTEQDGPTYRYLGTLTEGGRTWGYSLSPSYPGARSTYRTEPGGASTRYDFGEAPNYILDPLNRETWLTYTGFTRLLMHRFPERNEIQAGYDARGNLNLVRRVPRPGSALPMLESSAVFPAACTANDRRSCNQPTSTTDFNGNTSDFTYDAAHGGVLTATGPAVNGVRPQTRHIYAQRYAWISNGSGGYAQAATPAWVRTATSLCRTSAATGNPAAPCATAGDEVLTQYDYGPDSGPNNLLLRGQTLTATDGGVTTILRTCYGYDGQGRRISETQPNANLGSCP
jgi:YD repeat-containing protein